MIILFYDWQVHGLSQRLPMSADRWYVRWMMQNDTCQKCDFSFFDIKKYNEVGVETKVDI